MATTLLDDFADLIFAFNGFEPENSRIGGFAGFTILLDDGILNTASSRLPESRIRSLPRIPLTASSERNIYNCSSLSLLHR